MSPMRIFRAASTPVKHQALMTIVAIAFVSVFTFVSAARADEPSSSASQGTFAALITPQNILTLAVLLYGAGMLREQFNDVKRRLEKVESAIMDTIPETYVRKDVLEGPHAGLHMGGHR